MLGHFEEDAARVAQAVRAVHPQCVALSGVLRSRRDAYLQTVSTLSGEYKKFARRTQDIREPMQDIRALSDELRSWRASAVVESDPLQRVEQLNAWTVRVERAAGLLLELQSQVHFFTIHKEGNLETLAQTSKHFSAAHDALAADLSAFQEQLAALQAFTLESARQVQEGVRTCFVGIGHYLHPDKGVASAATNTPATRLHSLSSPRWNQRFIYKEDD